MCLTCACEAAILLGQEVTKDSLCVRDLRVEEDGPLRHRGLCVESSELVVCACA